MSRFVALVVLAPLAFVTAGCEELDDYIEGVKNGEYTVAEVSQLAPGECLEQLERLGVVFAEEPTPDQNPGASASCHIETPVRVESPLLGVDLIYHYGEEPGSVLASCNMALALAGTAAYLEKQGAVSIRHLGTYNCRVVANTDTLSQHAFGDAIDIAGFEFDTGVDLIVAEDWEIDNPEPELNGGDWLYKTINRWHQTNLWITILTPDYDAAHADHFHMDQKWGESFLGLHGEHDFGAPTDDHWRSVEH